jgi:hypothetical protein
MKDWHTLEYWHCLRGFWIKGTEIAVEQFIGVRLRKGKVRVENGFSWEEKGSFKHKGCLILRSKGKVKRMSPQMKLYEFGRRRHSNDNNR